MRSLLAATLAVVLLATAGCAPDTDAPPAISGGPGPADVDVDTAELRALKKKAGVEPCLPGTATASRLPELTLPCLGGGRSVDLSTLTGPMVVNLWYAGCAPCKEEMPALAEFHDTHGDRVPVLGIDYQDVYPGVALKWVRRAGATYPQLADPGGELNGRAPFPIMRGAPYLGFVDERGDIVHHKFGGIDSSEELVELVREHLGVDL